MINGLNNALLEWFRSTSDRKKLQHVYLIILILSVVLAGLVSLIDPNTGQDILLVSAAAGAIYIINAVLWALFESTLLSHLSGRRKR